MPSLTRWVKAQRLRAPANALAPPANQRAGNGSPLRYVNRRAWESRLATLESAQNLSWTEQPESGRLGAGLAARANSELAQNRGDMVIDGLF